MGGSVVEVKWRVRFLLTRGWILKDRQKEWTSYKHIKIKGKGNKMQNLYAFFLKRYKGSRYLTLMESIQAPRFLGLCFCSSLIMWDALVKSLRATYWTWHVTQQFPVSSFQQVCSICLCLRFFIYSNNNKIICICQSVF